MNTNENKLLQIVYFSLSDVMLTSRACAVKIILFKNLIFIETQSSDLTIISDMAA
jgi:hypothetical protein